MRAGQLHQIPAGECLSRSLDDSQSEAVFFAGRIFFYISNAIQRKEDSESGGLAYLRFCADFVQCQVGIRFIEHIENPHGAMRILDVFYEANADLTLHEISAKAKVGKTSAFRILFTLDSVGYVEKDPASEKYRLGLGIIEAARKTLAGRDLVQLARPHLKKLRDEFDETTNLAALKDDTIVYLEIFESHHSFRMTDTDGSRVPRHSTALGKSIAAFLDQEKLKAVLKQSARKRFTPHTITGVREYSKELAKVREQGYSLDNEESELGATCVAAPIFTGDNVVVGALSVSGPTPRIRDKQNKITAALKGASAAISRSVSADRSDR